MKVREVIEHRYKNQRIRIESDRILSVPDWRKVNAKINEISKILKEGAIYDHQIIDDTS